MTRIGMCGVVLAGMLGMVMPVLAAEQVTARPTTSVASPSTVEGSVIGVDARSNSLKITAADGKTTWTLALDPKTPIWGADGQRASAAALSVGQRVQVSYLSKQGKQVAQSVKIQGASMVAPAAASTSQQ